MLLYMRTMVVLVPHRRVKGTFLEVDLISGGSFQHNGGFLFSGFARAGKRDQRGSTAMCRRMSSPANPALHRWTCEQTFQEPPERAALFTLGGHDYSCPLT